MLQKFYYSSISNKFCTVELSMRQSILKKDK